MPTVLATSAFRAGVNITGNLTGAATSGDLRFTSATASADAVISTNTVTSPRMIFSHFATGNSGTWLWRNSDLGLTTRMTLDAVGQLLVTGGVDVQGSPTGYTGGEIKFSTTTGGALQGLTTWATGQPTLSFDHRGTSNTGGWIWRNGTNGASTRMILTGTGVVQLTGAPGTTHESNRVDGSAQAYGRGFSFSADLAGFGSIYGTNVSAGLSIAVNRADPAVQFSNTGGTILECMGSSSTYRFYVAQNASQMATADVYLGQYGFAGARLHLSTSDQNVVYMQAESAGADCNLFFYGKGGGIHRFYDGQSQMMMDVRQASSLAAQGTALYLYWRDTGNTAHFTPVYATPLGQLGAGEYVLRVA